MEGADQDLQSVQAKQYYLRKNILEEGYDADQFASYLGEIKPDGFDLTLWTLSELKDVVKKYKSTMTKPNAEPEEAEEEIISVEKSLPKEFENFPVMHTPTESDIIEANAPVSVLPVAPQVSDLKPRKTKIESKPKAEDRKEDTFDDIADPYERMMRIVTQYEIKCKPKYPI